MKLSRNFSTVTLCLIFLHPCCVGVTLLTIWEHSTIHRIDYSQIYKILFLLLWESRCFLWLHLFPLLTSQMSDRLSVCVCVSVCLGAQLCSTLCDPADCSSPGSSVYEIFQTGVLEWLSFSPPGDLPNPGIEPCLSRQQADSSLLCYLATPLLSIIKSYIVSSVKWLLMLWIVISPDETVFKQ